MGQDRKKTLEEVFGGAVQMSTPSERSAFLDGACGSDAELRSRVEALLAAHDEAGSFLVSPAVSRPGDEETHAEGPGTRIGPYKLLQLIGEGGFGAVYMAEQEEPVRRRVALKIIKLGMDTKQVIARFEAERQALAMMDHPNIARVLDAGTTGAGRPYFVMELVHGVALNQYCDKNKLPARERLHLFLAVCRAVQHAHLKGIIHRDLKPGNVLVTLHDGTPVPKVIDFGIARATHRRLTEKTLFTEYGQFIGTPEYMSPEQAEMSGLDIDTRTDVYSLGVILYELLTGTTPLDRATILKAGWGRIQEVIREHEPQIPSTRVGTLGDAAEEVAKRRGAEPGALSKIIRGDLDWIVMKSLEKDRTRRYATAYELSAEVKRHLDRQPVLAGPPSMIYKLRKFVERHRVGVTAGAVVAFALIAGLALATFGLVKARSEASRSRTIAGFLQDMLASTDPDQVAGLDIDVQAVVRTAREVFGDDHATVAATLESRAVQLQNTGNPDAAEVLYEEALRIWREQFGRDHLNVAVTLARLGTLYSLKGDGRAAEKVFRESLRLTESTTGKGRVIRTLPLFQLGGILMNHGKFEEAEQLLRECTEIVRTTAPEQHLRIALVLNTLANSMVTGGKIREAESVVRETLAAFDRALPERSLLLAKVKMQVGHYFLEIEEVDDAETAFREAIEIYAANPEIVDVSRNTALTGLAMVLTRRDDMSVEFAKQRREYVELLRRVVPEGDPYRGEMLIAQAGHLAGRTLLGEALALALEAHPSLTGHEQKAVDLAKCRKMLEKYGLTVVRAEGHPVSDYRSARRAAELLLESSPDGFVAQAVLAMAEMRLGRRDEAREQLAKLRRIEGAGEELLPLIEVAAELIDGSD